MLCDSNILIYAAEPGESRCAPYVNHEEACIASVTRIEVLGFPGFHALEQPRQARLEEIITSMLELALDEAIVGRAVILRRQRRMSIADAIIAATAIENNLPLVTRNAQDYKHIDGLTLINPFDA